MKVALLSHRGGNIGHDFMAAGFERVLSQVFGPSVVVDHFEQHRPFCVFPEGHWSHRIDAIPYGRHAWLKRLASHRVVRDLLWRALPDLRADVAIACGGPNIVAGASRSVEMRLMFLNLNGAFAHRGVPLIDAGVGACFPLERVPARLEDEDDRQLYRDLFAYSARSTVRDRLAHTLWRELGRECDLVPCAAIASGLYLLEVGGRRERRTVVFNIMERGANEDWGQGVDSERWAQTVSQVAERMSQRHPILFLCHDDRELSYVRRRFPQYQSVRPGSLQEYAKIAVQARAILANRIHAMIPFAGCGVPGVAVGTDTRLGAIDLLGLKTFFVKHVDANALEAALEDCCARAETEGERLVSLRDETILRYGELIQETMDRKA